MIIAEEKQEPCYLCKGKKYINMIKRDPNSKLSEEYYTRNCPLCSDNGSLFH